METNQMTILKAVERIYMIAKDSQLAEERFNEVENELKLVNNCFKINKIQSILLATIISKSCLDSENFSVFAKHFGVEEIRLMHYLSDIEELESRRIIQKNRYRNNYEYSFNQGLISFLSKNEPIPEKLISKKVKELTIKQCLSDIVELKRSKENDEIDDEILFQYKFWHILEQYKDVQLIKYILDTMYDFTYSNTIDAFVFLSTIIDAIKSYDNDYNTSLQSTVDDCTFLHSDAFSYISTFLNGKTLLNKLNLVEKDKAIFGSGHNLRLSDKAVKMLREWEGIKFEIGEKSDKLLYPNKIQSVNLFYNPEEKEQLDGIINTVSHTSFKQFQKRLRANNMPTGITVLFYGEPGTGKTETVYQIAKKYKRPVFKVDISETKSMWFGESQKLVKKIFTDYSEFKKSEKICPILLFNEADAVIGKRKAAGSSNVADTENAIQNILLEELEAFDGILFATSNLIGNIDSAFERRFLFKIKFAQPNTENATKIWQSKLQMLSENEALFLSQNFHFSGGEMENIARKCIMEEVISGQKATFEHIVPFCENEKWNERNNKTKIGFL